MARSKLSAMCLPWVGANSPRQQVLPRMTSAITSGWGRVWLLMCARPHWRRPTGRVPFLGGLRLAVSPVFEASGITVKGCKRTGQSLQWVSLDISESRAIQTESSLDLEEWAQLHSGDYLESEVRSAVRIFISIWLVLLPSHCLCC